MPAPAYRARSCSADYVGHGHAAPIALVVPSREVTPASARSTGARRTGNGLVRASAFLILLAVIIWTLDAMIDSGLRRMTTSGFGVTNRIVNGRIAAEILISGSSRALVHYNPRIIAHATGLTTFNIGRNGSQTDLQVAVLKTYLRHNPPPRLLIHNLDLYAFVTSHEIYDPAQYLPYLDEEPLYSAVRRVYPDAWKWKYLPLHGYLVADARFTWMLGLRSFAGWRPAEDHIDGFVPRPWKWTGDFEQFRRDHPNGIHTPIEPQGLRDLQELLSVARSHHIPVLLVYSPEYFEVQALQRNRARIFALFHDLGRRFEAPLWDFGESAISRQQDYFYNSQHLNAGGAAAFSQTLARRLVDEGFVSTALSAGN